MCSHTRETVDFDTVAAGERVEQRGLDVADRQAADEPGDHQRLQLVGDLDHSLGDTVTEAEQARPPATPAADPAGSAAAASSAALGVEALRRRSRGQPARPRVSACPA
jgi:hypothetical protein